MGLLCLTAFFCCTENARCLPEISKEFEAYMLEHHYGVMPTDQGDGNINRQTVEAKINGRKVMLVVDTGAWRTVLTNECARRLKLDVHDTGHSDWGFGGNIQGNMGVALVQSFTLSGCEINRTNTIGVFPKSAYAGFNDGLLGLDFLRLNAVILPVGGSGFLLKPGPTPVVSIVSYMNQLGYKPIPVSYSQGGLMIEGHINSHLMRARVDSGAVFSVFDPAFVRIALGHNITSMPVQLEGVDGRATENYRFTPTELDFGGFNVQPIMLVATHTPIFSEHGFAGFLGFDLLGLHRGIIDLGDDILWIK